MDEWEVAAQAAAVPWTNRNQAREQLRELLVKMLEEKSMSEISRITGIKRTTLYYILYGRAGKLHDNAESR